MARLMPLADEPMIRQPGRGRGQWRVSEAFDAPLPHDVLDAFEGTPAAAPPPRPSRARPKRG